MLEVLMRAGCFVAIIALGYILRRVNFFKEGDFAVLSKILLNITLPATIVTGFAGKEIAPSMLFIAFIGLGGGIIHIVIGYIINRKNKERQALEVLGMSGYNVGAFTFPFVQSFLGGIGIVATSLFDIGNAFICFGGAYGVAKILKNGEKISFKKLMKTLIHSVPFDCYIIMLVVSLLHIPVPAVVAGFAEIISGASAFVAMLMIGVGFKLVGDKSQAGRIVRVLAIRYAVAMVIGLSAYFFLPFSKEVRLAVLILAFSPIPASAVAYTEELKDDVGFASALNSISIICSIVFILAILMITL